jgi:hypothetical protein
LLCDAGSRWVLRILCIGLIGMAATTDDVNPQSDPPGKPIATATWSGATRLFSRVTLAAATWGLPPIQARKKP